MTLISKLFSVCFEVWLLLEHNRNASSVPGEFMHNNSIIEKKNEGKHDGKWVKEFPGFTPGTHTQRYLHTFSISTLPKFFPCRWCSLHTPYMLLCVCNLHMFVRFARVCACVCFIARVMGPNIWVGPSLMACQQISPSSQD